MAGDARSYIAFARRHAVTVALPGLTDVINSRMCKRYDGNDLPRTAHGTALALCAAAML
jgi:hypothetical protein